MRYILAFCQYYRGESLTISFYLPLNPNQSSENAEDNHARLSIKLSQLPSEHFYDYQGSYKGNRFSYCHFFSSNLYDQINDHQKIT